MENREYWSGNEITSLKDNEVFIFGSNSNLIKIVYYIVQVNKELSNINIIYSH